MQGTQDEIGHIKKINSEDLDSPKDKFPGEEGEKPVTLEGMSYEPHKLSRQDLRRVEYMKRSPTLTNKHNPLPEGPQSLFSVSISVF